MQKHYLGLLDSKLNLIKKTCFMSNDDDKNLHVCCGSELLLQGLAQMLLLGLAREIKTDKKFPLYKPA